MAWLGRVDFAASDVLSYTDVNNVGNDIRAWGGNVNGGGYSLANVVLGSISSISGGTGAASSLTLQSTSGTGTSDYIVFKTASQSEKMRITTDGRVGIGYGTPSRQVQVLGAGQTTAAITDAGNAGGTILITDSGSSGGNGGALLFGAAVSGGYTANCAIKSVLTDGTANGVSDLAISTRASTGATALTERMRVDSSGNVGIGTPSPTGRLHVRTTTDATNTYAHIAKADGGSADGVYILDDRGFGGANSGKSLRVSSWKNGGDDTGAIASFESFDGTTTPVLRVGIDGNVGIGTASPSSKLVVTGGRSTFEAASEPFAVGAKYSPSGGIVYFGATNGTATPDVQISNAGGGALMTLLTGGNVGIGTSFPGAKLTVDTGNSATSSNQVIVSGGRSVSNGAGAILFTNSYWNSGYGAAFIRGVDSGSAGGHFEIATLTDGSGASGTPTVRMRVNSSGYVGIGVTNPSYQLQLSTDSAAKPTTNTWTIASDERIKTVTGEYSKGLAEICQVRPVRYEYNGKGGFEADGKEQVSILAQELAQVFPECVGSFKGKLNPDDIEETDILNYNGHAITFALINAIKELKAEIELLKART